jgi:hypothetical protein
MTLNLFVELFLGIGQGHGRPPPDSPLGGCGVAFAGGKVFAVGQMTAGSFPNEDNFPARVVAFRFFVERNTANTFDLPQVKPITP